MDFEFNNGRGLFVPVNAERKLDMHGNVMLHIPPNESPDGRERWISEYNPCIRGPGRGEPKLCIEGHSWQDIIDQEQGDRQFRGIR